MCLRLVNILVGNLHLIVTDSQNHQGQTAANTVHKLVWNFVVKTKFGVQYSFMQSLINLQ